jgi:hypothetical protein
MSYVKRVAAIVLQIVLSAALMSCGQGTAHPTGAGSTGQPATPTATVAATKAIWRPALDTSWQWQLSSPPASILPVQVYDIDGFDNSAQEVAALHARGIHVICYIDVGTWENWRSDAGSFPASVRGSVVDGFSDERWLDIRQLAILEPLIVARMQMCKDKGFDAIEPDNIDGYENDTGFPLTAQDQIVYNTFLAATAHKMGLSIGLKNDIDQVQTLVPLFDWTLNEQCFEYQECDKLLPFIQAGKAVFNVEYNLAPSQFCPQANAMNFNSLKKHVQLDAYRVACR